MSIHYANDLEATVKRLEHELAVAKLYIDGLERDNMQLEKDLEFAQVEVLHLMHELAKAGDF